MVSRVTGALIILLLILGTLPGPALSYYQTIQTVKQDATADGLAGFMALQNSTVSLETANLSDAVTQTQNALKNFNAALTLVSKHSVLTSLASIVPVFGGAIQSRQNILLAGQEITIADGYMLQGLSAAANPATASSTLIDRIQSILKGSTTALPNYQAALDHLSSVNISTLPLTYQGPFQDFKSTLGTMIDNLQKMNELGTAAQEIFGGNGFRRYLIIFQNPYELRPTGGFMGSFALLDVDNGKIVSFGLPPGGSYDVQGQLDQYVTPPTPLSLVNNRWEFQDANWFPDFPTSAKNILWFYRHSRQITADGVIAVNATVLQQLLSLTGPITDENQHVTLSAATAVSTIQQIVENGPDKASHKPKQILTDLAPQFLDYFQHLSISEIVPLLQNAQMALNQKEIQAYFTDPAAEQTMQSFGWSGALSATTPSQDYLMVVDTNIGGQKSDAKIKENISQQALINDDGSIIDNVVITRTHTGEADDPMYGATSTDYIRVYVPEGSTLLKASGFTWPDENSFQAPEPWDKPDALLSSTVHEVAIDNASGTNVTNEFGKTAFGNWISTPPNSTSKVSFTYRLPFKLEPQNNTSNTLIDWGKNLIGANSLPLEPYQLLVQKQSGTRSQFSSQVIFPAGWSPLWSSGPGSITAQNGLDIPSHPLLADSVWSVLMQKQY